MQCFHVISNQNKFKSIEHNMKTDKKNVLTSKKTIKAKQQPKSRFSKEDDHKKSNISKSPVLQIESNTNKHLLTQLKSSGSSANVLTYHKLAEIIPSLTDLEGVSSKSPTASTLKKISKNENAAKEHNNTKTSIVCSNKKTFSKEEITKNTIDKNNQTNKVQSQSSLNDIALFENNHQESFFSIQQEIKNNNSQNVKQAERYQQQTERYQQILTLEEKEIELEELKGREKQLLEEIQKMKAANKEMVKKCEKYKQLNQENKKYLKDKIHNFNSEGEELRQQRNKLKELQEEKEQFRAESIKLKQINEKLLEAELKLTEELQDLKLKINLLDKNDEESTEGNLMLPLQSVLHSEQRNLQSSILQNDLQNEAALILQNHEQHDIQRSRAKESFEGIIQNNEYKRLIQQYQAIILEQHEEIFRLEIENVELSQKYERKMATMETINIQVDSKVLINLQYQIQLELQIRLLHEKVFSLEQRNQENQLHIKYLQAERHIQKEKVRFYQENDINSLKGTHEEVQKLKNNIIQLRKDIEKEKGKYEKLLEQSQKKQDFMQRLIAPGRKISFQK